MAIKPLKYVGNFIKKAKTNVFSFFANTLIGYIDELAFPLLKHLVDNPEDLTDRTALKIFLGIHKGMPILKYLAEIIPSEIDNKIVEELEQLVSRLLKEAEANGFTLEKMEAVVKEDKDE